MEINSSQEILYSSQNSEENNDLYRVSTQEVIKGSTQEAINATEYFDNLVINSSQESVQNQDLKNSRNNKSIKIENIEKEKKKRGRKRKIRTEDELKLHLKEKKEKNRLAAQRLRQRKCNEIAKYDKEVEKYENLVKSRKTFAQHLQTKVNQLRNRIEAMIPEKRLQLKYSNHLKHISRK